MTDIDPTCENECPPEIEPGAGGPIPTDITIGDIDIEELDVTASGLASVRRCDADCNPVDVIICKDENHAGGQGTDTDTGDLEVMVIGWVDAAGVYTPGAPPAGLQDCGDCPIETCSTTWAWREGCLTDGTRVRWVEGVDCDGNPIVADPVYYPCGPEALCADTGGGGDPTPVGEWVYRASPAGQSKISYDSAAGEIVMSGTPGLDSPSEAVINWLPGAAPDEIGFLLLAVTEIATGNIRRGWVVFRPGDVAVNGNEIRFNYGQGPEGYYTECGKAFDDQWAIDNTEALPFTPPVGATTSGAALTVLQLPEFPDVKDAQGEYVQNTSGTSFWSYHCGFVTAGGCGPLDPQPATTDVSCDCVDPVHIDNDCADPIPVETCPGNPLEVIVVDQPDDVEVDVEWVCNEATNVFDQITTTTTNGVVTDQTTTPTTIPCSVDLDYEQPVECRAGTRWVVLNQIAEDGTVTELSAVDTGEPCSVAQAECVKWRSTVLAVDNTGTRYNESHELTITHADGTTTVLNAAPQTGWSQQINHWVTLFAAEYPTAIVEARCNLPAGCGGLLPPPSDAVPPPLIKWRYMSLIFCPTEERVPVKIEITASSNPARVGKVLDQAMTQTPERRGRICYTCGEADGVLLWPDGSPVDAADIPACFFDCAETIPAPPPAVCQFDSTDGCDNVGSVDPTDWVNVIRTVTTCEGVDPVVAYSIVDPTDPTALIDYTLVGQFVDCASGEPVPEPPAECDADIVLCDVVEECPPPDALAFQATTGRPNNATTWQYGDVFGATYGEFSAAMAAAGFTEYIAGPTGEAHFFTPCTGAEFTVGGVSQGIPECVPNPNAEPVEQALRVHLDDCSIDALMPDYGRCGADPEPTPTLTMTPGGAANGGVCDADLLAWLKPAAGVKTQIKVLSVKSISKVSRLAVSRTAETAEKTAVVAEKTTTALKREVL